VTFSTPEDIAAARARYKRQFLRELPDGRPGSRKQYKAAK
jgi:hypothetical protein